MNPNYTVSNAAKQMRDERPERKSAERDKNQEIENLKRLLASISQRLDDLKNR